MKEGNVWLQAEISRRKVAQRQRHVPVALDPAERAALDPEDRVAVDREGRAANPAADRVANPAANPAVGQGLVMIEPLTAAGVPGGRVQVAPQRTRLSRHL